MKTKTTIENKVREIKRTTRRKFSAEEKIRIVLEVLRAEDSLAAICRRDGIYPNLYYNWSKEFLEAGKKRLNGDIQRQATSNEVAWIPDMLSGISIQAQINDIDFSAINMGSLWDP